jgi:tRNA nucleotidyltransferase (CCA-adding enzyme)
VSGALRIDVPSGAGKVIERLQQAGHQAVVVGGCVRDALLGRTPGDWDVATSAHPDDVVRIFRRTIPTGLQHGTVTVLEGKESIEVTTFRGEGAYSDARRPDHVVFGVTLEEDMSRRDFTVNAMAYDPIAGTLHDPHGGRVDLDARTIRAVGDPVARFREDGLRVMRAVRFAATLEFAIEPATLAAIPSALPSLARVAAERVQVELLKLLGAAKPSLGLVPLQTTGILGVILPELVDAVGQAQNRHHAHDVWTHTVQVVDATPGDPVRRLGALLHDVAKPRTAAPKPDAPGEFTFYRHDTVGAQVTDAICRRLKLSNDDRERVVAMVAHHMFWYTPEWTDATVRRFVQRVGAGLLPDLFALREGDVIGRGRGEDPETELGELRARTGRVLAEKQALAIGDLAIGGNDVMTALGVRGGKVIGDTLKALLERVVEDPTLNQRERLLELIPGIAAGIVASKPPQS